MSPRDVNLVLRESADPLTTTGAGDAVDTEGGFRADVRCVGGTLSATQTHALVVQASIDGGSNYYDIGAFPSIDAADDDIDIARSVYIPKPTLSATVTTTKVRIYDTVTGTPSWPVDIFIEPLVSLAAPALDDELATGLAKLV